MKIDLIKSIIAVTVGLLLAYGFQHYQESEQITIYTIGGWLSLSTTALISLGVSLKFDRSTTMVKLTSGIFFIIFFISNCSYILLHLKIQNYVIVNGLIFMIYLLIIYSIIKSKQ